MKRFYISITALCMLALVFMPGLASAQDTSTAVKDGGIFVKGWTGQIDANETKNGQKLDGSRLSEKDGVLHVTTGPSVSYWQSDEKADGSYMVMATFTEPKFKTVGVNLPIGIWVLL